MDQATLDSSPDKLALGAESTEDGSALDFLAIRRKVGAALFPGAEIPVAIARFRVLDKLGSGAMGTVFSAWDPELERRVAIKVLAWHAPSAKRMKREAKALARLSHPNVVTVHEVGNVGDSVFLAMEFVRGRTLGASRTTACPRGGRSTSTCRRRRGSPRRTRPASSTATSSRRT